MGESDNADASINTIDLTKAARIEPVMRRGFSSKDVTIALLRREFTACLSEKNQDLKPSLFLDSGEGDGHSAVRNTKSASATQAILNICFSKDCDATLRFGCKGRGRVNACLCNQGKYVSITARLKKKMAVHVAANARLKLNAWNVFSVKDAGYPLPTQLSVATLAGILSGFDDPRHVAQGLVVISGGTGSGKTQTAQALVLDYLLRRRASLRRIPHLVTFEDPIEPWKVYQKTKQPNSREPERILTAANAVRIGINFTARERDKDVQSLTHAIRDAKRQTPACMFIGEVRDASEWEEVLEFAGSGHLVVVTTHAGSLVETIGRLLRGVRAKTPAERGWAARQILGCVHIEKEAGGGEALLPAVWAGRPKAVNDLIADGLSAVVPNGDYILSRQQFIERVAKKFRTWGNAKREGKTNAQRLNAAALALDLKDF